MQGCTIRWNVTAAVDGHAVVCGISKRLARGTGHCAPHLEAHAAASIPCRMCANGSWWSGGISAVASAERAVATSAPNSATACPALAARSHSPRPSAGSRVETVVMLHPLPVPRVALLRPARCLRTAHRGWSLATAGDRLGTSVPDSSAAAPGSFGGWHEFVQLGRRTGQ